MLRAAALALRGPRLQFRNRSQLSDHPVGLAENVKFAVTAHCNPDIRPASGISNTVRIGLAGLESVASPSPGNARNAGQDAFSRLHARRLRPSDPALFGKRIRND